MEWWRDARFGMFIYWGVHAYPAGKYHTGSPFQASANDLEYTMRPSKYA